MAAPPAGRAPVSGGRARLIDILLIALIVFDLAVAVGAFLFPQLWYRILHDAAYVDPQGLLRRTGAIWAAFTVLQVLALPRWRTAPYWLVLVCGIRLSEMFADWTYLAFADHVTPFGTAALIVTLPANLLICWFLFATYGRRRGNARWTAATVPPPATAPRTALAALAARVWRRPAHAPSGAASGHRRARVVRN